MIGPTTIYTATGASPEAARNQISAVGPGVTTPAPIAGDVLVWNGTAWVPSPPGNPYLVDPMNIAGAGTTTYYTRAVAENTAYIIRVQVLFATQNSTAVGAYFRQVVVHRATGGNITLSDGPNTDGDDFMDTALAGTSATIDVDVASQSWRIRVTTAIGPAPAYTRTRALVQLLPIVTA